MERYKEHKGSGIEWNGEFPLGWDAIKIKYISKAPLMYGANESAESDDPSAPRYIRITDIDENGQLKNDTFKSLPIEKAKPYMLHDGDLLFARSGATVGKTFCYSRNIGEACFAGYLIRLSVNTEICNLKYVSYFTQSKDYVDWIQENTIQATIQNVSADKYANLVIPYPSLKIQATIVSYLDHKTDQINRLIADKEKLIELLKESQQSFISEAVTKGLDKTVPTKGSGIEWIGNIPAHWEITRIKNLFRVVDNRNLHDENATLLSLFTAIGVKPRSEMEEKGNKAVTVLNYKHVKKNDLIVNKLLAWMGAIAYSDYDGVTSPDYDIYRALPHANVVQDYYHHYFRDTAFKSDCFKYGHGIMMMRWRTYSDEFLTIPILNPPKDEQTAIANYVHSLYYKVENIISDTQIQIAKLKEYRQSLISEAVTGKIKVTEER